MLASAPRLLCVMLVGRGGVEPPTSRLSGVRSNHLSYRPPPWPEPTKAAGGVQGQLRQYSPRRVLFQDEGT